MIKLENVSKFYHSDGIVTQGIRRINLTFKIGELIAITGESGSGKSTLLNVITGFDTYEEGEISINGVETSAFDGEDWENYRKEMVSFIFQSFNLIDSYTVLDNVEAALIIKGVDKKSRREKALDLIDKVGLTKHINKRTTKLSGGERQRVSIARALAMDTPMIVADEPTGNLDSENGKEIFKLLSEISKDRLVIIVTHDFEGVSQYATRKIKLIDGEVVEDINLKPFHENTLEIKPVPRKVKLKDIALISKLNLIKQPKKTLLITLISLFIYLFIFLLYGSFILTEYSKKFQVEDLNVFPERIIVRRIDETPLTNDDYKYFIKNNKIESVFKEDLIVDTIVTLGRNNVVNGLNGRIAFETYDEKEVVGRLPKNEYEVLISVCEGSYIYNHAQLLLNHNLPFYFNSEDVRFLKIVGIHYSKDVETKFLFTDTFIKNLYKDLQIDKERVKLSYSLGELSYELFNMKLRVSSDVTGNQIMVNKEYITDNYQNCRFFIRDIEVTPIVVDLEDSEISLETLTYLKSAFLISDDIYNQLEIDYFLQHTLILKSPKDAQNVVRSLHEDGYFAFSPYFENYLNDIDNLINKVVFSIAIIIVVFVVYFISFLIIRTILLSRIRDYAIIRIIGVEQKRIKNIVLIELLSSFIIGILLFILLLIIFSISFPKLIGDFASNLFIRDYLVIAIINLLIAWLISRRYNKYVDKKSLINNLKGE